MSLTISSTTSRTLLSPWRTQTIARGHPQLGALGAILWCFLSSMHHSFRGVLLHHHCLKLPGRPRVHNANMVLYFVLASVRYASVLVCLTSRRAADEGSKESEHGSFFFTERGTLFASPLSTTLSTMSCRSPQKSLPRDSFHDAQAFRSASR